MRAQPSCWVPEGQVGVVLNVLSNEGPSRIHFTRRSLPKREASFKSRFSGSYRRTLVLQKITIAPQDQKPEGCRSDARFAQTTCLYVLSVSSVRNYEFEVPTGLASKPGFKCFGFRVSDQSLFDCWLFGLRDKLRMYYLKGCILLAP